MRKYKISVDLLARQDVKEAGKWYNQQQKGLERRLNADLKTVLLSIAANPTSFAIRYRNIRLANLSIFPFAVHFFIEESAATVFVVAVIHTSRHPSLGEIRIS